MSLKFTPLYLLVICCLWATSSFAQIHGEIVTAADPLYTFTVTSANATVGATYTNNGKTFTVSSTISGGTTLVCVGTGSPAASGTLTRTSGTGDATITFSSFIALNPMNPNGDNYITATTSGFVSTYGPTDFEFVMHGVPTLGGEAKDDNIGNPCGITDLIPDSKNYSVYAVKDASFNLILRYRVGANNASVEAWTMLLDTDGKFGPNTPTNPNYDPNYTAENPGFEIDITLIKNNNKGIYVYDIDGIDSCPTQILFYDYSTHFQISRADTDDCNDPDYFYDFFVPFTDVVAAYNAHKSLSANPTRSDISVGTGLRFAAVTNTSATCAMGGNIADVGGVDNNVDPYKLNGTTGQTQSFLDIIENQCPTIITDLCATCAGFEKDKVHKPTIDPVNLADPTVSGTIDPLDNPVVYVKLDIYHNTGTVAAPTWSSTPDFTVGTFSANRIWSITLPTTALYSGRPDGLLAYDKVVATVQIDATTPPCGSDGGGNTSTSSVIVTCTLSATISAQTNVSCFGSSDGSATVVASGGIAPYTYSWNSNPIQTTATATLLAAGTYEVTVRDATSGVACKAHKSVTITQQAALNATVSFTNVTINGAHNGTITVNGASGGYGNYEYSIDNGVTWQTSNSFTGLDIGTYNVVIRDKDHPGCTKNLGSVSITQPGALSATVVTTNALCFGGNGTITISNPTGGGGTYEYTINGGTDWFAPQGGATSYISVFSVAAGVYNVKIRDAANTSNVIDLDGSNNTTITQPSAGVTVSGIITDAGCFGAATGAINITASGGTSPYTYDWADIAGASDTEDRTNLAMGTYSVTATDANNCTSTLTPFSVSQPTVLSGSASVTVPIACFNGTGTVTVTASGGTAPLSYTFDGVTNLTGVFTGVASGTGYAWSVTDANACGPASGTIDVSQPVVISVLSTITDVTCFGGTNGAINITATGGAGSYSYAWTGTGVNTTAEDQTGLTAGTYTVTVTDGNSCTTVAVPFTVNQPLAVTVALTSQTNVLCNGASTGAIDITASGGTGPYTYAWTGTGVNATAEDQSGLAAGLYSVIVTDVNSCVSGSFPVTITSPAAITGSGAVTSSYNGSQLSCATSSDGQITITASGGNGTLTYSLDGGAYQASNIFSGLSAGTHTISVQDANACTTSLTSVTITAPASITGSGSVTSSYNGSQLSCASASDGQITITASGGSGTLMYSLDGGAYQASNVFSGLSAGTHTISVKDANSCSNSLTSVTITAPASITGSGSVTSSYNGSQLSCASASDGQITITASGGSGTLTYSLDGGAYQASNVFSGLSAGTHTISVKDANSCSNSLTSVTITAPASITGSGSVTSSYNGSQLSCATSSDGQITITASGGNGTLTYSLDGGAYQASNIFSGLSAGTHTISVQDANACNASLTSVTITAPASITGSGSVTSSYNGSQLSCASASDGQITITASGGSGTLTYSLDGGAYQVSNVFSGLSAGTHTISVKDANSCSNSLTSVTITAPASITGSGSVTSSYNGSQLSCASASDGQITITASGGSGTLTYSLDGGAYQASNVFSGLSAGTHTISVKDANSCSNSLTSVTITAPASITGSGSVTSSYNGSQLSCASASDGQITITASGGSGTLTYSLDGGAYQASNVFSGLAAGTHTISVKDANTCSTSLTSVTINAPASITGSGSVTSSYNGSQLSCASASDGQITITASGGSGTLTYSLDGGAYQASNVFSGLSAGTHTISVKDANSCSNSLTSVTIIAPASITGSGSVTSSYNGSQLSCASASDGQITITASGGSGTLTYSLDGGAYQASNVFSGLSAGTHTISVKDANSCSNSLTSVTITAPASITGSGSVTSSYNGSQLSCASASDGQITITASGGSGTLTYSLDGGAYQASNVFSGLSAGTHTISVKDANSCSNSLTSVTITAPASITGSGSVTSSYNGSQLSCGSSSDGQITITASGGSGTLTYSLDGGAYQASNVFSGLSAGTHTISVKDANSCSNSLTSVTITAPASITGSGSVTSSYNGSQLSCGSSSDGQITITASGGSGTLTYSLDGGAYQASNVFSGLSAGTHTISVKDANSCSNSLTSVTITAPASITGSGSVTSSYNGSQLSCGSSTDGQITITASGGSGTLTYSLDGGAYQASNVFSGLAAGTHTISVKDANTCSTSLTSVTINAPASISGSGSVTSSYNGGQISCTSASDGQITITASGGSGTLTYSLDGGAYQASNIFSGLGAGTHTISVQDANACTTSLTSVTITPPTVTGSGIVTSTSVYNGSQLSCATSSDGQITVTATGGSGTLTYSLDGGAYQPSNVFTGVGAGTHTISVQDANACATSLTNVTITPPTSITGSGSVTSSYGGSQVSCVAVADGEITITASGGTGTLMYSLDGGTYQASNVFSGLSAGTHSISVTDANSCVTSLSSVTITPPTVTGSGIVTSTTVYNGSQLSCSTSSDGQITVNATGGTGTLTYSLDGGAYQNSNVFTGVGAGTHTISVTDANACATSLTSVTITPPTAIGGSGSVTSSATYNGSQLSCSTSSDGQITVTASGGTGTLTYSLDGGTYQASNVFTGVGAGTHTISVTDANACATSLSSVTITPPTAIGGSGAVTSSATYNGSQLSCSTSSDGQITVSASGGTGTLTYSLDGGTYQASNIFTGVGAGTHTISVTDANACATSLTSVVITPPNPISGSGAITSSASYNGADLSCSTSSDGQITVNASGGTGTLTYSLDGGTYQSSNIFTGVGAGTHTISVTDANACATSLSSVMITPPTAITGSGSITSSASYNGAQLSCSTSSDGQITVSASGGTGTLTYSLDGGSYQSSNVFTNIGAGTHTISVTDANACITSLTSVVITPPPTITGSGSVTSSASYNGSQLSCSTSSDGQITVSASGGTGTLNYSLDGGTYQASNVFTNIGAGTHTISVTDANACATSLTSVNITPPPVISGSGSVTSSASYNGAQLSCATSSDGQITVNASGGTGTLTYSIDGGTYQASNVFTGIGAGTHTISVTDANACATSLTSVNITPPTAITGSGSVTSSASYNGAQLSCATSSDGQITVTASGGTGTLTYSLDGGTYQNSNVFTGVGAGNHTISVTDANACATSLSNVMITPPTAITGSGSVTSSASYNGAQLSCATSSDGQITVSASGGTGTLTYSIDGGVYQSSNVFSNVGAGTHTISVTDDNACTTSLTSVAITPPAAISGSGTVTSNYNGSQISCASATDGQITVTASGGTGTLTYSLDGGTYQTNNVFSNLGAGSHTISVQDANGCTLSLTSVNVNPPASPVAVTLTTKTDVLCNGATTGAIDITASGGVGPYTYSWTGPGVNATAEDQTGLAAGNYDVTVTDANGCNTAAGSGAIVLSQPNAPLQATAAVSQTPLCHGDPTGVLVTATGGSGTYIGTGTFSLPDGSAATTYDVTDANGCATVATTNSIAAITSPSQVTISITSQADVKCFGGNTGTVTVAGANGTGTITYSQDNVNYAATSTFGNLAAGSYTIYAMDANGCKATQPVVIGEPASALTVQVDTLMNETCAGSDGAIYLTTTGGTSPYTYTWSTGFHSEDLINIGEGTYTISVTDNNQCNLFLQYDLGRDCILKIYQAVSPNGDGKNDYWRIDNIEEFPGNTVRLFDRYNNLVYQTHGYNNDTNNWTGQANHGLARGSLPDDTYFYWVDLGGSQGKLSGYLVLKH